jgi:hypothetical protein
MKIISLCLPLLLMLSGCGRQTASTPPATPASPALAAVFSQSVAGENLPTIPQIRNTAVPGDTVSFRAKVMGTRQPFVDGRALMVVGDPDTMTSCDLMSEDDHCETPWDLCCEAKEALHNGTATVQIVDAGGKVLPENLRGNHGLKELSLVRITGTVAPVSTARAFIINAQAIEVLP